MKTPPSYSNRPFIESLPRYNTFEGKKFLLLISIYINLFLLPTFFFCAIVVACYFMLSWESRMNKISAFLRGVQGEGENQYERLKYGRRWRAFQQHTRVTKNKITYSMHVNNNSLVFFLTISSTWTTIDFRCAPSEKNSFGAPVCR
jgi:hypothetical protein